MLTKSYEISDPKYGTYPGSRSLKDHINNGFVVIDKPSGPSSHQVTAWVRDMFSLNKAGHSGTLDPKVTGILVITLGNATKVMPALMGLEKEYIALMQLHKDVDKDKITQIFEKFKGEIIQKPPKKSAVKRVARKREIYELEIMEINGRFVLFRVLCEAGTYIRKLIDDMGKGIGGAHMKELRRTKAGPFTENDMIRIQDLQDSLEENKNELKKLIMPVEKSIEHLPFVIMKDSAVDAVCNGAPLSNGGIIKLDDNIEEGDLVSMLSGKGELVAIGKAKTDSKKIMKTKKIAIKTDRVLMERGVYPQTWKKKPRN